LELPWPTAAGSREVVFMVEAFMAANFAAAIFTATIFLADENFGATDFGLAVSSAATIRAIMDMELAT